MGWAATEFETIDLGDERRNKRAIRLVERLSAQPTASVPQACGDWADRYRQDQGRLRDSLQPPLLRLQAAAPAGRDRRRTQGRDRPHPDHDWRADSMSLPRYPNYKDRGVEWLGGQRNEMWLTIVFLIFGSFHPDGGDVPQAVVQIELVPSR